MDRWLADLLDTLDAAGRLVARGRAAYDVDPTLPFAFEALSNRVGDLAKRLVTADPERFNEPIWRQAAKNRDFVVHHYGRIDQHALWLTVSQSFVDLRGVAAAQA